MAGSGRVSHEPARQYPLQHSRSAAQGWRSGAHSRQLPFWQSAVPQHSDVAAHGSPAAMHAGGVGAQAPL